MRETFNDNLVSEKRSTKRFIDAFVLVSFLSMIELKERERPLPILRQREASLNFKRERERGLALSNEGERGLSLSL